MSAFGLHNNANGDTINVIHSIDDPMNCDVIQAGVCIDGNGDGSATRPVVGGDFFGNTDPDGSGDKVNKDFAFDDQNSIKSKGFTADFQYDFEWMSFTAITDYTLQTDSISVFGQTDYSLTNNLVLVAGLRLIKENKDFDGEVTFFPNTNDRKIELDTPLFTADRLHDDNNQRLWSGKIKLEYSPDERSLY